MATRWGRQTEDIHQIIRCDLWTETFLLHAASDPLFQSRARRRTQQQQQQLLTYFATDTSHWVTAYVCLWMESVQHQQLKNVPLRDMLLYFTPSRVNKYRGQNEQGSVFTPSFWIEASNPRFGRVVTEWVAEEWIEWLYSLSSCSETGNRILIFGYAKLQQLSAHLIKTIPSLLLHLRTTWEPPQNNN